MKTLGIYYATACYRDEQGRYYTSSGLGRYLDALVRLYQLGIFLAAPTTTKKLGHLAYPLNSSHVNVFELPYFERFEEARRVRQELAPRLQQFLHQHPCDVVWLRYPAAYGTIVWKQARVLGIPCFMEIVGDPVAVLRRTKRMSFLKKVVALGVAMWHEYETEKMIETTPTVAVSRFLRQRYSTPSNLHNILTLPCGTLFEEDFHYREDTCSNSPFCILSVARLDHMKSLHTLIDAVSVLQAKKLPVRLEIVGTGPEQQFLVERAQRKLFEHSWQFHGGISDQQLHETYCRGDVFALPSIHEGLGRVYYEAMARGLPVVATWVDGIVDVVLDGVTGLLVPPSNPAALASALEAILTKPSLRRRLIQNGYQNARRFMAERFIEQLLEWASEALEVPLPKTRSTET